MSRAGKIRTSGFGACLTVRHRALHPILPSPAYAGRDTMNQELRDTLAEIKAELGEIKRVQSQHTTALKETNASLSAIDRQFEQERRTGGMFEHKRHGVRT